MRSRLANGLRTLSVSGFKPQVLLFLTMLAGWMNRKQQLVIDYLLEENKVLREQLDIHANGKRLRYTAKQKRRLSDAGR